MFGSKETKWIGAAAGMLFMVAPLSAFAQPPVAVAPLPGVQTHGPRRQHGARVPRQPAQDRLVTNFEQIFGRKLTADQVAQLAKATDDRTAAFKAAQDAWQTQFLKVTGLTQDEFREKQKAYRQQQIAQRNAQRTGAAAGTTAPAAPAATK